ncbi:hypothetical protein GW884_00300 [Candidatus Falkowbacteria bacterium]|nr:hypothetical protein [Candidatus Falkowbacteria bacterium]
MIKSIHCQPLDKKTAKKVKVRMIKAPLVNSEILKQVLFDRARALVL